MGFDRSEHEPEEWDPEAEYADPDSDSLTIPRVATEDAGSGLRSDLRSEFGADAEASSIETDVPSDLLRAFWAIVLVVNAAVLALSLGVIFLFFEGPSTHALALIVGGIVLFGLALRRYRNYRASDPETTDDDAQTTESDPTTSTAGDAGSGAATEPRSPDDTD